jgi:hypothetical protein
MEMTPTIKQGDTLYKVQDAIRVISNEEDTTIFSDELFEKCHALDKYVFYMRCTRWEQVGLNDI